MQNILQNSATRKNSILIVDDEDSIRNQLKWGLRSEYEVSDVGDSESALQIVREHPPDIITIDLMLSQNGRTVSGLDLIEKVSIQSPNTIIIVITGHQEKELALKAIEAGAHDYFLKPFNIEELKTIIRRRIHIHKIENANKLRFFNRAKKNQFHEIIGKCPAMLKVFDSIKRVGSQDVTVLIHGESGTGKELVAQAIHHFSNRNERPIVTINCGAIPETLLEAELFGHEKGAFTGAHIQRKGKFEIANHGTIFLDEIGDLSPTLQVKLLRFLEERTIERIGGREPIEIDVRVIAATNKMLEQEIKNGNFRGDLFYRLCVIKIDLPLLKDRGEDILLLADYFLSKYSSEYHSKVRGFSLEVREVFRKYSWPGNVRELENKIKRAVIMAKSRLLNPEDLNIDLQECSNRNSLREMVMKFEKHYLQETLIRNGGNVAKAAEELMLNRTTFYDMVKKYGINLQ
ncbi:MAG: PEP-CTERM-box response regulator transcription factor, partial [bacterium]